MATKGFQEDDGVGSAFAELPVDAAYVRWTRGDGKLGILREQDPGIYFGGWKARVEKWNTETGEKNPPLPYPVVKRTNQKGDIQFDVYATNVLHVITIATRTRYELRVKEEDSQGQERTKVTQVSLERKTGFTPNQQIFGLAFNSTTDEHYPVVISIDSWSAFISFQKASQNWKKVLKAVAPGKTLIRRYGSVGKADKTSGVVPNFEEYGQGYSTPIEAIDMKNPRLYDINDELNNLQAQAQEWKNDPMWLKEGRFGSNVADMDDEGNGDPFMDLFAKRAKEIGLTNIEIQDLVKSNGGDYEKAYDAIAPETPVTGTVNLGNPFNKTK